MLKHVHVVYSLLVIVNTLHYCTLIFTLHQIIILLYDICYNECSPIAGSAGAVAGAATGGFIGGVLLTAAIAGVIALVVLCRANRRGTTELE